MTSEAHDQVVVVDNGSRFIKAGFAGDDAPHAVFASCVGKHNSGKGNYYAGDEALAKREILRTLEYPIKRGIITDWDNMERLWNHTFSDELRMLPQEDAIGILMTESPLTPKQNRERMTQIVFETFQFPNYYVSISSTLALYASGRNSGIILDCGDGHTSAVPNVGGYCVENAIVQTDINGHDITQYLGKLLDAKCNTSFTMDTNNTIIENIKEKVCFVALDYENELQKVPDLETKYELPDGEIISIGKESFIASECLFKPYILDPFKHPEMLIDGFIKEHYKNVMDKDATQVLSKYISPVKDGNDGIAELLYKSIMKCSTDIRRNLWANIILNGGCSMFNGIQKRLEKEIKILAPNHASVKVIAPPERKYAAWIGGSILGSLSTFQDMWITKQQYDEIGPFIVHTKCDAYEQRL